VSSEGHSLVASFLHGFEKQRFCVLIDSSKEKGGRPFMAKTGSPDGNGRRGLMRGLMLE